MPEVKLPDIKYNLFGGELEFDAGKLPETGATLRAMITETQDKADKAREEGKEDEAQRYERAFTGLGQTAGKIFYDF